MRPSRVGVEIGGTFTDLVWHAAEGALRTAKVPSTPDAIQQAVLDAFDRASLDVAEVG